MVQRRVAAAEAARRLMEGFSPRSNSEMQWQAQQTQTTVGVERRAVDESDYDEEEDTESEGVQVTAGTDKAASQKINDKKYALTEI